MNRFDELVQALSDALGESSGLNSADVDVDILSDTMARYATNDAEWSRYALADPGRAYTRNLVDEGNGKSNLVSYFPVGLTTRHAIIVLTGSPDSSSSFGHQGRVVRSTTTATPTAS
jgi:hypothetical protein